MPTDKTNPTAADLLRPLVEGIDYYIENGRWVFMAEFHLNRGSCCGSSCRHCPYGDSDKNIKDSGRRDSNPHEG